MSHFIRLSAIVFFVFCCADPVWAIFRDWDDGAGDKEWGTAGNWDPHGVPVSDDDVDIGSRTVAWDDQVLIGGGGNSIFIRSLKISSGADLSTNGNRIVVQGAGSAGNIILSNFISFTSISELIVDPYLLAPSLEAYNLGIHGNSRLTLNGAHIFVGRIGVTGTLYNDNEILGYGVIDLLTSDLGGVGVLLDNRDSLTVRQPGTLFGEPPARTLDINIPFGGNFGRVDLDGSLNTGTVTLTRNTTLDIADATPSPQFYGTLTMFANATFAMGSHSLNLSSGGRIDVNSGAVAGLPALPAIPAVIGGSDSALEIGGGELHLDQSDETLIVAASLIAFSGTIFNTGTIELNNTSEIRPGLDFITTAPGKLVNNGDLFLAGAMIDSPVVNKSHLYIGSNTAPLTATAQVDALTQSDTGQLHIDVGGVSTGQWDKLVVDGDIMLDGTIEVTLINDFAPVLGDTFLVLQKTAGTLTGQFENEIMPVFNGLTFDVIYNPVSVRLQVSEALGLPGDYNEDGSVDAADYVVWRKNEGTANPLPNDPIGGMIGPAQYDQWRANFGATAGSGSGATGSASAHAAVPEPHTMVLFLVSASALLWRQRQLGAHRRRTPGLSSSQ